MSDFETAPAAAGADPGQTPDGGYSEADCIPLSALQHYIYCPRQCALIHLEQAWAENWSTAMGRVAHERAHEGPDERRPGVRIARGMPVRSLRLGVSGQCDVVEIRDVPAGAVFVPGRLPTGARIVVVEYKRGKPKAHRADEVQVCAQAICLEEMFDLGDGQIVEASLFYGETRKRTLVSLDPELRALTAATCLRVHALLRSLKTPFASYEANKCNPCSLIHICEPKSLRLSNGARAWFDEQMRGNDEQ